MKLSITSFRGSTQTFSIEFDKDKPLCMIFGENGNGKSTIIDALDVVCNGNLGSLAQYSGAKPTHALAIGTAKNTLQITLAIDNTSYTETTLPSQPSIARKPDRPHAHILRRIQMLQLLLAQPAERYSALKSLIELSAIENAETGARDALRQVEQAKEQPQARIRANSATLQQLYADNIGTAIGDWRTWAKTESETDLSTIISSADDTNTVCQAYKKLQSAAENCSTAKSAMQVAEEKFKEANINLRSKSQAVVAGAVPLVKILTEAKTFLSEVESASECPVCEQTIEPAKLSASIDERLVSLQDVVTASNQVIAAQETVATSKSAYIGTLKTLHENIESFDAIYVATQISTVKANSFDFANGKVTPFKPDTAISLANTLESSYNTRITTFTDVVTELEASLGTINKQIALHNSISQSFDVITQAETEIAAFDTRIKFAKTVIAIIENKRKNYASTLLDSVAGEIQALYSQIHLGEPLGNFNLKLDAAKKGSIDVSADFHGNVGILPQSYYSESHMDTLGLCAFIALAKKQAQAGDILVLDDVLTSCDVQHLDRIINILEAQAPCFSRIIVTTHYRPWRDRYRIGGGSTNLIQLVELLEWNLPTGIRHASTRLAVEELQIALGSEPLPRQSVASQAGVLLEAMLDRIATIYECKVPYVTSRRNLCLGDYFGGLTKQLKTTIEIERPAPSGTSQEVVKLENIIKVLDDTDWIRNQVGCHFNLDDGASDGNVKAFGQAVLDMAGLLGCSNCGSMPYKPGDGSTWRCSCGALALSPLKMPTVAPSQPVAQAT